MYITHKRIVYLVCFVILVSAEASLEPSPSEIKKELPQANPGNATEKPTSSPETASESDKLAEAALKTPLAASSSIKPRKGVVPKSISPRKGVELGPVNITRSSNTSISETIKGNQTAEVVEKKKFKPKPVVTVGDADKEEKPIVHGNPTRTPPLGMSSKLKYVFPVMMTILLIPLLIIGVICIYKNGRDCWDKRHYRRMDFLIDGMYNE